MFPGKKPFVVNILKAQSVGVHGFFLEIPDKTMSKPSVDHVHEEVQVEKPKLTESDANSHESSWVS